LSQEVRSELELVRDRAQAQPMPRLKSADVMLSGEPVREFLRYYLTQGAAESIYNNVSRFKVGDSLQGPHVRGDRLSIRAEPYLSGSTASRPWDGDGFPLRGISLVDDGVLRRIWGPTRFCHYLGAQPTGAPPNIVVGAGSRSLEAMRGAVRLEVAAFSDFHSDPITGDFGGEVRLGYLIEGGSRRPVTGGSISGNLKELHGEMYLSRELQQLNSFRGPRAVQLFGVSVTGVA
jgi:predicted Zn-dependent protease